MKSVQKKSSTYDICNTIYTTDATAEYIQNNNMSIAVHLRACARLLFLVTSIDKRYVHLKL